MPRCITQILSAIKDGKGQLFVSYLQIYCESISDLLVNQVSEIPADTPSGKILYAYIFIYIYVYIYV
jgi:hypothetical protein